MPSGDTKARLNSRGFAAKYHTTTAQLADFARQAKPGLLIIYHYPTLFVIATPNAPFVPAWYQGDLTTNGAGRGVLDVTGIFSDETFILNPGPVPVQTDHLGIWFADPADAVKAGCPGNITPFDGDHNAGIQVLNTSNFAANNGPLLRFP